MGFKIVSRKEVPENEWNHFADSSDMAWLWHRYDFTDLLLTWPGYSDLGFAVFDESQGHHLVALCPLFKVTERRCRGVIQFNKLFSFGGIAFENGMGHKHLRKVTAKINEEINSIASFHSALCVDIVLAPMTPAYRGGRCPLVNPLLTQGYHNRLSQTWIIDLRKGIDETWKNIQTRSKTAIRKAVKNEVTIRRANSDDLDLDSYYRLHLETYRRTGASPHPKKYFKNIWELYLQNGFALILFAEFQGEVIAAENFGIYKSGCNYWTGAASNAGLRLQANSLLQWEAMKIMIETGVEWYETGEAFPNAISGKTKGLNDFKRSFGGVLYPFYKGGSDYNKCYSIFKALYR